MHAWHLGEDGVHQLKFSNEKVVLFVEFLDLSSDYSKLYMEYLMKNSWDGGSVPLMMLGLLPHYCKNWEDNTMEKC